MQTFQTAVSIPSNVRAALITMLNQQLADTADLYTQVKQAHWNVKGSEFIAYHKLFDDVAGVVIDFVDTIAERVTAIGGTAMGTARMAAQNSRLPEYSSTITDGRDHIAALVARVSSVANSSRSCIEKSLSVGDQATADIFIEMTRSLDKYLWFLQAHIQA